MIKIARAKTAGKVRVTFVLPDDVHPGAVSVRGDFTDNWAEGILLRRRQNGTRSAAVEVEPGTILTFRYLGSGGRWFNETDSERVGEDSVFRVPAVAR